MSLDSVRSATWNHWYPRFVTAMNAEFGSVPLIMTPNTEEPTEYPFVAIEYVEAEGNSAALNNTMERYVGFFQADVYVKENTGTIVINKVAEAIKNIIQTAHLASAPGETLTYRIGHARPVGTSRGKYRVMVRIPYIRDVLT